MTTTYTSGFERSRAQIDTITEDETGSFEAVASHFDSIASGEKGWTRFARTAFDNTVKAKPTVPVLWQHDSSRPIGTAALRVVPGRGLVARAKLALGTRQADEARALMKAGAVNSVSIGFTPKGSVGSEVIDGQPVRLVHEADVMEISLVTFGADPAAKIVWMHRSGLEEYIETLTDPGAQGQRFYDLVRDLQRQRR